MSIFDLGTGKIETFFFLHREIIKILNVVFSGYKTGEHRFLQPDMYQLGGKYEILLARYSKLINDHEIIDYIDHKSLHITNIDNFDSLTDDFDTSIEFWNSWHKGLLLEKAKIDRIMSNDEGVERDIKLIAYEIDKLLPKHQKLKEEYFSLINPRKSLASDKITLDTETGTIRISGLTRSIQIDTNVMIFLRTIIEYKGKIVGYKVLADKMALNANRPDLTDKEIAPEVHDVKKLLKRKLKELGFDSKRVDLVMNSLVSQKGVGYKFVPSPR